MMTGLRSRPFPHGGLLLGLLLAVGIVMRPAAAHADISYIYDELGRLRAVIDPAAPADGTAIYTYDAVGNILSITRQPATQVAVIEFTPKRGPVGTTVTIQGSGFSATPSANAVTFNGVAATVTAATATELVTAVPAGATTGPIGVTAPGGSSSSSQPFTVTADTGAPTITSFTPNIGSAGTAVTISGGNFETQPTHNTVRFEGNHQAAPVTTASSTSLGTSVPPSITASGPISVATPAGKAVSADDFFVPVGGYTAADLITRTRMAIGETKTITIPTANKVALVIFDGAVSQKVSVLISFSTTISATVAIYQPDGSALMSPLGIGPSPVFVDTKTLPVAGTYSLTIAPGSSYTGSVTITLSNVVDIAGSITPGGPASNVTISTPGQNARLSFSGTTGQRVSLSVGNVTGLSTTWISILKPDGTTLTGPISVSAGGSGYLDAVTLPTAGTYTVFVDPYGRYTGALTLTLYDIVDLSGTINIGGSAVTLATTVPGQNGRLTFSGAAGQRISLYLSNVTITVSDVSIVNPDGSTLATRGVNPSTAFIDTQTLGSSGTFTILLDPRSSYTGSMTFTLYNVPADLTNTITPGGSPVTVNPGTPGQNATLTFNGTAGQRVSLRMTATIVRSYVSITNPDGSTLVAPTFVGTAGAFIDTKTLTQTGTHTILVNPDVQYTGSVTLTLYDVPPDVTGTLTIGGPAVPVTLTTPGQNAGLTFSGTTGQQATVRITSNTVGTITVTLRKPDGSQLTASTSSAASFNLATQTLPTTGTYTVSVDPYDVNTGSLAVAVTSP